MLGESNSDWKIQSIFGLFVHDCGWPLSGVSRKVRKVRKGIGDYGAEPRSPPFRRDTESISRVERAERVKILAARDTKFFGQD